MKNSPPQAAVIESLEELAALRGEWSSLWDRCPHATPFQSPEWLIPWWQAFRPGRLCCLAIRESGRLAGLAPLYREPDGMVRLLGAGHSDYLDVLFEPGLGLEEVFRVRGPMELQDLRPEASVLAAAPPGADVGPGEECPVIALPPTVEAWKAQLPHGLRRNLRRYREHLSQAAEIEFRTGTAREDLAPLFRLHETRWRQMRGETGVLAEPGVEAFHREVAEGFSRRGWLRVWQLMVDGGPACVIYGFAWRTQAAFYISGFDPRWARFSPGTLTVGYAAESLIGEGIRELHFLRGREPYKYLWGAADRPNRVLRLGSFRSAGP